MSLARHQQATPAAIATMYSIAASYGYSPRELHNLMDHYAGNIRQVLLEVGHGAWERFQQMAEMTGLNDAAFGDYSEDMEIGAAFAEETSLSNSPESGQAMSEKRKRTDENGGESNVEPVRNVWTHFPNTQTARLKYINTIHYQNMANYKEHKVPFGAELVSGTDLSTTGGNVTSANTTDDLGSQTQTLAQCYDFAQPFLIQLRMTSPYNIIATLGQTSNTAPSYGEPNWLSFFDSMYTYYHVLECNWHLSFHFGHPRQATGTANKSQPHEYGLYIFYKYTNEDDPPTSYQVAPGLINAHNASLPAPGYATLMSTNETALGGVAPAGNKVATANMTGAMESYLTSDDYKRQHNWKIRHVKFSTTHNTETTISGHYKYGQCKSDIKTLMNDAHGHSLTAEQWTLLRSTVPFKENASIVVVQDQAMCGVTGGTVLPFSMHFEIDQLIQFKDLRAAYKFPTPSMANNQGQANILAPEIYWSRGATYQ